MSLIAVYWRTNRTMRQIGPLFGISHSAAHGVVNSLGPLLELTPVRKRGTDQVAIVDGRDPRPSDRDDTTVYRESGMHRNPAGRTVMADGDHRGEDRVTTPFRKQSAEQDPAPWREELNARHRRIRARAEHALAGMRTWRILCDSRRAASTLADTTFGIGHLRDLARDS